MDQECLQIVNDLECIEYFKDKSLYKFVKLHVSIALQFPASPHAQDVKRITSRDACTNTNTLRCDDVDSIVSVSLQQAHTQSLSGIKDTMTFALDSSLKLDRINTSIESVAKSVGTVIDSNQKIETIKTQVQRISEHFGQNSSKKGKAGEESLLTLFNNTFPDASVEDTASMTACGDMKVDIPGHPMIIVDSKNFSRNVPKKDIDKFYRDVHANKCCGILCSAFSGISSKQNFEIDTFGSSVIIFVHNHQYDQEIFKLAVRVIKHIHTMLNSTQNSLVLDSESFSDMKAEYNTVLAEIDTHTTHIKNSINALTRVRFALIDAFFKRGL